LRGWNSQAVAEAQRRKWAEYVASISGTGPLGVSHEGKPSEPDTSAHNTLLSYGYSLARAAHQKQRLALLDWGGGVGHYLPLSRVLVPDVAIDYHCRDLPELCRVGRELQPGAVFHETAESALARGYDFVVASSSLQYSEDWQTTAAQLARVTQGFLFVTRTPIVHAAASFVVVQRPWRHGYDTEYPGWFLNRQELVDHLVACGLGLVREFLIQERPRVREAPEQCEYRGFLFQPKPRTVPA
jgi:putative methyltransferase (TIGR04325 family)